MTLTIARIIIPEGWELDESAGDVLSFEQIPVEDMERLSFKAVSCLKRRESEIPFSDFKDRSDALGANLGLEHVLWLLEHPEKIPREARTFYLFFPRVRAISPNKNLYMLYLEWDERVQEWRSDFDWAESAIRGKTGIEREYDGTVRLLVPHRRSFMSRLVFPQN